MTPKGPNMEPKLTKHKLNKLELNARRCAHIIDICDHAPYSRGHIKNDIVTVPIAAASTVDLLNCATHDTNVHISLLQQKFTCPPTHPCT